MLRVISLVLGGVFLAGSVWAQDRVEGRKVANMCRTCHGLDGFAKIPIAPHIGGEPEAYLQAQLKAFKNGSREHEMMSVVAAGLTDQQIADVAAWYSGHIANATVPTDAAEPPEICSGCHGDDGLSKDESVPNLAGETNIYIDTQLKAFKRGTRTHEIMSGIAADLSDEDIRKIADWYAAIKLEITQIDEGG